LMKILLTAANAAAANLQPASNRLLLSIYTHVRAVVAIFTIALESTLTGGPPSERMVRLPHLTPGASLHSGPSYVFTAPQKSGMLSATSALLSE
jgi:hypothetical protein